MPGSSVLSAIVIGACVSAVEPARHLSSANDEPSLRLYWSNDRHTVARCPYYLAEIMCNWLEHDGVALAILLVGLAAIELLALVI